ncbi:MAG: hypothetical protein J0I41_03730 [Filimonas sp.]|nr:hypothetical protein [Filimonas sp.]
MKSQPLHGVFECHIKEDKKENNTLNSFAQTVQDYVTSKARIVYYESVIIPDADKVRKETMAAFEKESINESQLLSSMKDYMDIQEDYLKVISAYHHAVISMESLFDKEHE